MLIKRKGVNEGIARDWLERFLRIIIFRYYQQKPREEGIEELIDIFLDEIERGITKCRITAWLHGIYLEVDKVELDEGVILRAPIKDDLEVEIPLYPPVEERPQPIYPPHAILEIERKIEPNRVLAIISPYECALQLYKCCPAYSYYVRIEPQGVVYAYIGGHYKSLQSIRDLTFRCSLTSDDVPKIRNFINKILPKLPLNEWGRPLLNNYLGIAFARYQDALLKTEPLSNKLAYAVFGLEALYLGRDEFGELRHRLAQRVAKVMHLLGKEQDPMRAYESVKKAYNIRSRFVHGGYEELKDIKLLIRIVEYLRLSILIFMFVDNKKSFLDLIDRSMLSEKANEKLRGLLRKILSSLYNSTPSEEN